MLTFVSTSMMYGYAKKEGRSNSKYLIYSSNSGKHMQLLVLEQVIEFIENIEFTEKI